MGLIFGAGSALLALLMLVRLLPRLLALSVWLGSAAITGGLAFTLLYAYAGSAP
jgi:hypothetical protein